MVSQRALPIDLGDGLVLRCATRGDATAVAAFNAMIHSDDEHEIPMTTASVLDLFGNRVPHPTTNAGDFTVVEDTATGEIVSSLCLIPQTWNYDGINVPAALVEFVGTRDDYRNRGLVRRQFDVVHQWCVERGILVQGIAGIPSYYRQFGYEYALDYGVQQVALRSRVPELDGDEPFVLRRATTNDAAFIASLEGASRHRWLVSCVRDERTWRYEIAEREPTSSDYVHVFVVERPDQTQIGYVAYSLYPNDVPWVEAFSLDTGASWLDVVPTVLRHLLSVYDAQGVNPPSDKYAEFEVGKVHPAYEAMPRVLTAPTKGYALYVRVGDVPTFLQTITPSLEARLERSVATGFSGELAISFYRSGVRLVFEAGRITDINTERLDDVVDAALEKSAFTQMLFGYRSLAELSGWYADLSVKSNSAQVLIEALFPKHASNIRALG